MFVFVYRKRRTRTTMIRLLGTRVFTRLLLLVCSLSLISLLFLSRCGLSGLDTANGSGNNNDEQEQGQSPPFLSGKKIKPIYKRKVDIFKYICIKEQS